MLHNQRTLKRIILLVTSVALSALTSSVRGDQDLTCTLDEIVRDSEKMWLCQIENQKSNDRGIKISIPSGSEELKEFKTTKKFRAAELPEFQYLPDNFFEAFPNLHEIRVTRCALEGVFMDSFKQLSNLKELVLQENKIKFIQSGAFDDLSELIELNLSYNQIKSLNKNIFDSLKNLQVLGLHGNHLSLLDTNLFANLPQLLKIFLDGNYLKALDDDQFKNNNKLVAIVLNGNPLNYLSPKILEDKPDLKTVSLHSSNCIHNGYKKNNLAELIDDLKKNCSTSVSA